MPQELRLKKGIEGEGTKVQDSVSPLLIQASVDTKSEENKSQKLGGLTKNPFFVPSRSLTSGPNVIFI